MHTSIATFNPIQIIVLHMIMQELSPVSVSTLCGSAREQQTAGGVASAPRMHAVTLDSLRVGGLG